MIDRISTREATVNFVDNRLKGENKYGRRNHCFKTGGDRSSTKN
jgi:hypothetical protein